MAVSRTCDECLKIKRCRLYRRDDGLLCYLCRRCARVLGYVEAKYE